jgi:hypothetical protein
MFTRKNNQLTPKCRSLFVSEDREGSYRIKETMVYICSPYSGDVRRNIEAARRYCRFAVEAGYIPFAPHLFFPQFMDDHILEERDLALSFGESFMDNCSEVWVFGNRISPGMSAELKAAIRKRLTIRFFPSDCLEDFNANQKGVLT